MEQYLNKNWKFLHSDGENESIINPYWEMNVDDKDWKSVTLPHDWAVSYPFSKEWSSGTGYVKGGIGWYRLHFTLPKEYEGKRIQILFGGVYKHSQTWCNGYYLGKWANGYTCFSYDITEQARFGEENVLVVRVSHNDVADSRWYTGSGINREVKLLVQDKIHIQHNDVFFEVEDVNEESAKVQVTAQVNNHTTTQEQIIVHNKIVDTQGNTVAHMQSQTTINGQEELSVVAKGEVKNPKLWSVDAPNCYTLQTSVEVLDNDNMQEEGLDAADVPVWEAFDVIENTIGIRTFVFDANDGFSLNGESMKLKGVCLHEDAGCIGSAVPRSVWVRRLERLKAMGCNAIRMSHNPHAEALYELCDRMGFLVIDEIFDEWEAAKNKWSIGHNVYPPKHQGYFEDYHEWHEKDVEAFIKMNRNRPSIIMWSVGNEIDYPNDPYCHPMFKTMTGNNDKDKPAAERQFNAHKPNAERLAVIARHLVKLVKQWDVTRPVSLAAAFPELSSHLGYLDALDVVGYNYKEHLYDEDHVRFPDKPFLGSENGHSYEDWLAVTSRPFISGQFLWTGIDYLGESRGEWPWHGSPAGNLDLAGNEKSEYYFRQSLWSSTPMVHMVTARPKHNLSNEEMLENWNYYDGELVEVRVFTNQSSVELFCNEKSLGRKEYDNEKGYVTYIIPFEVGSIKVIGEDSKVFHAIESTESVCGIRAKLWDQAIVSGQENIIQIEVETVDRKGNRVITDSSDIHVHVEGEASLLGIENGNLEDITDYTANHRRTYHGRLLVMLRCSEKAGEIMVSLEGEGLQSQRLQLTSKA